MLLKTLGGLALKGVNFTRAKPLLLLAYLALEGSKERRHLAELFWQEAADALNSLSKALYRLRQTSPGVIEADNAQVWTSVQADALQMLAALEHDELEKGITLYGGAFLEGLMLPDWGAEVEEWVYSTREFLARRVQEAHLQLGERQAAEDDFKTAAKYAEAAYKLPGAAGLEPEMLERAYLLLVAGESALAPEVRREAEGFGIALRLSAAEAQQRLRREAEPEARVFLPTRRTSFIGRAAELERIAQLLAQEECRLLTLAGAGGSGKTKLVLEAAHRLQASERFKDGVFFVPLESLASAEVVPVTIASALGLQLQGTQEPLVQLYNYLQAKHLLLVLDNFEHLPEAVLLVSKLLTASPELKVLVTSREKLNLIEEWVLPVGGLALPPEDIQDSKEALKFEAIQLFVQRAMQADLDFVLTKENLGAVISICHLVDGSPLGIELAAVWVRLMPPADIAAEIEKSLDFLQGSARNVADRHRSIRATFEYSWTLLTSREQEALSKLSVFRGGFTREAASEVAGASISLLASLLDKSLLRISSTGRYDRHPLLHQYIQEKLAENPKEKTAVQVLHAKYYLALAEEAEPQFRGPKQGIWLKSLEAEHENLRAVLRWAEENKQVEIGVRLAGALTQFWWMRGYWREGYEQLTRALSQPWTAKQPAARINALNCAGIYAWSLGDYTLAHVHLTEGVNISREAGNKQLLAHSLSNLGAIARRQGEYQEARQLLEESAATSRAVGDKAVLVSTLNQLGALVRNQGSKEARQFLEESITVSRELGDKWILASSLVNLGQLLFNQGHYASAASMFEESFAISQELGSQHAIAEALYHLGLLACDQGDYVLARSLSNEALATFQGLEEKRGVGSSLDSLGLIAARQAEYASAHDLLEESLGIFRELGDNYGITMSLHKLGFVLEMQDNHDSAHTLFEECLTLSRKMEDEWNEATALSGLGAVLAAQGNFASAHSLFQDSLTIMQRLESKKGIADLLGRFAGLAAKQAEKSEHVACLWSAAQAIREGIGAPLPPSELSYYVRDLEAARIQLGEADFKAAWEAGRSMTIEEVIAYTLQTN